MVGYIRESDRKMVNLGRIDGKLSDWDGSSGMVHQVVAHSILMGS